MLEEVLSQVLSGPVAVRLNDFLDSLPDNELTKRPEEVWALLKESVEAKDVDSLREMSTRIIPMGPGRAYLIKKSFTLTSSYPVPDHSGDHGQRLQDFLKLMRGFVQVTTSRPVRVIGGHLQPLTNA